MWIKSSVAEPPKGVVFVVVINGGAHLAYRDKKGGYHTTGDLGDDFTWAEAPEDVEPFFRK